MLINGEPKGHIVPTRGIRQGDPLSPYLFLLCSEGLNGLLEQAVHEKHIEGFSLCRHGPKISHLFFADDSLLFCRARVEEVEKIQELLRKYEMASGQKINALKTTIFFSRNVPLTIKELIQNSLGVPEIKEYEKYLGLPAVVGRNKKGNSKLHQRPSLGETPRMEGEAIVSSGVGGFVESSSLGYSYFCHELFSSTGWPLPRY